MEIFNLYENLYVYLRNIKLRKQFIKEKKDCTSIKKINYKKFWKKYYNNYNKVFHNFYFEKTGIDSQYFIPDDFYYTVIDSNLNNPLAAKYLDDKNLYDKLFSFVKQPLTLARKIGGIWFVDDKPVRFEEVLNKIIKENEIVCKIANNSCGGSGVKFLSKPQYETIDKFGNNLIVQQVLDQCSELSSLSSTSLNTIRVMTLLIDNHIEIISSYIRFSIKGARVDNASQGGATCGITEHGRLKDTAYLSNGKKFKLNPNTNRPFTDIVIPKYNEIKKMAIKCHESFPFFKLISWDFAIDKQGNIIFIEGNFRDGGLDDHQLNNGPLFGNKLEYYLNKILRKD